MKIRSCLPFNHKLIPKCSSAFSFLSPSPATLTDKTLHALPSILELQPKCWLEGQSRPEQPRAEKDSKQLRGKSPLSILNFNQRITWLIVLRNENCCESFYLPFVVIWSESLKSWGLVDDTVETQTKNIGPHIRPDQSCQQIETWGFTVGVRDTGFFPPFLLALKKSLSHISAIMTSRQGSDLIRP